MYVHGGSVVLFIAIHICIAIQDKTYSFLQEKANSLLQDKTNSVQDKIYRLSDTSSFVKRQVSIEDSPKHREKRAATIINAAVLVGMRAVRVILREATRVPSASPTRQYVKSGGYEKAIDDFMAANPIHVHSFELPEGTYVSAGKAGDRQLVIKHSGGDSKATIEVVQWKRSSNYPYKDQITSIITDEITYVD